MISPKPEDLTKEKSLLALWLVSFKFPYSRFNVAITACVALALARYCQLSWDRPDVILSTFRKLEATGLAFSTSILGFLVAGFTIFVTISRIDMFLMMARMEKPKTGESFLKYNLSAFIVAFAHYISYIFFCLMAELFFQPSGIISVSVANAATYPMLAGHIPLVHKVGASSLLVLLGTWTSYLVLLLKSFIFNIYEVTVTSIRYEWLEQDKAEREKNNP